MVVVTIRKRESKVCGAQYGYYLGSSGRNTPGLAGTQSLVDEEMSGMLVYLNTKA